MSQPATVERLQSPAPARTPSESLPMGPAPTSGAEAATAEGHQQGGDLPSIAGRDFASALDLIREASEAVRMSEERANDLEQQLAHVTARSSEQVRALEGQVLTTERRLQKSEERARAAEARATAAEAWLIRLHDAITSSFRRAGGPDADA